MSLLASLAIDSSRSSISDEHKTLLMDSSSSFVAADATDEPIFAIISYKGTLCIKGCLNLSLDREYGPRLWLQKPSPHASFDIKLFQILQAHDLLQSPQEFGSSCLSEAHPHATAVKTTPRLEHDLAVDELRGKQGHARL